MDTNRFFESVISAGIDYNTQDASIPGVAFREVNGSWNAVIASQYYCGEITNVPKPESQFYSFIEDKYTDYKYPAPLDSILKVIYEDRAQVAGVATSRYANIMDYFSGIPKNKLKKSRLKLHKFDVPKTETSSVMNFKSIEGKKVYFHDKVEASFCPIKDGPVPYEKIITTDGTFYLCDILGQDGGVFQVAPICRYGEVIADLLYTPGLYRIGSQPAVIPHESFAFNVYGGDINLMPETHVSTEKLMTILKAFNVLPPETPIDITFFCGESESIVIHGESPDTQVTFRLSVLDQAIDGQRE